MIFSKANKSITKKHRRYFALGAVIIAVLFCILWAVFPLPFFSLFMADNIGANIFLICLCATVSFFSIYIFGNIYRLLIPFIHKNIVTTLFLLLNIYMFSIFFYSDLRWVLIFNAAVYWVVSFLFIGLAEHEDKEVILPLIKRKPIIAVICGLVVTVAENLIALLLFVIAKNIFYPG
ncbi:MAG: hypothetical protein LBM87_03655 [Ruminococcus sp.]|jgi:hypothetical protein|nr:hypothetical protein [Ruminococcus sp.]